MMTRSVARALLALSVAACSAPPPKQVTDVEPVAAAPDPEPSPEPAPTEAPQKKGAPGSDEYELTLRDCDTLAQAYARSWLNDETAILDGKGLQPTEREKVVVQLREDAKGMYDNYYDQCGQTVGTAYLWSRLECASKAKSMGRFDDCLEGRADADD